MVQQYKQIGNAVPISLGTAVGNHIVKLLNGVTPEQFPGFKYSRYKFTSNDEWEEKFKKSLDEAKFKKSHVQSEFNLGL